MRGGTLQAFCLPALQAAYPSHLCPQVRLSPEEAVGEMRGLRELRLSLSPQAPASLLLLRQLRVLWLGRSALVPPDMAQQMAVLLQLEQLHATCSGLGEALELLGCLEDSRVGSAGCYCLPP